jgi:GST-like protein
MITLYGMTSPNVVKIFIALEEMGLPYKVQPVDVFAGEQFRADLTRLNPNAKVPVIVDEEGPGGGPYTVFESGAILLYLAEKSGRLLPQDPAARYDVIQWMMVQMTGVGPMFGQYVHFWRFAPKGNEYSLSRYRTQALRVCDVIEDRLSSQPWLAGGEYSIADVATFPWLRNIKPLFGEETAANYPRIAAWVDRIAARPAVARAISDVEELRGKLTQFDKAKPELLDRIFGRGQHAAA